MLQEATRTGNYELFKKYSESLRDDGNPMSLRSLMEFKFPEDGGIPIEEVEGVEIGRAHV